MSFRNALLLLAMLLIVFTITAQSTKETEIIQNGKQNSYTGTIKNSESNWLLKTDNEEKTLLLPGINEVDMKTKNISADKIVEVKGFAKDNEIVVTSLKVDNHEFTYRDKNGEPLWRIEGDKIIKYFVEAKSCIGCRLCTSVCPTGSISIIKNKAVIDETTCIGCGRCAQGIANFRGCPTKAIGKK